MSSNQAKSIEIHHHKEDEFRQEFMEKSNSDKSKQTVAKFCDQILILQNIFEIWLKSAKVRNKVLHTWTWKA